MNLLLFIFMSIFAETAPFSVSSPAFKANGLIPSKYTCEGANINPELVFKNIPDGTKGFVIVVEDPDVPSGKFCHWIVWDIPPTDVIYENSTQGVQGQNGAGRSGYMGPCPPKGQHRYYFKVYAMDILLNLEAGSSKEQVEKAMSNHILGKAEIIGMYKKSKNGFSSHDTQSRD